MQLRGEVFNLSFIFVHRLVTGIGRGFQNPQLRQRKKPKQAKEPIPATRVRY